MRLSRTCGCVSHVVRLSLQGVQKGRFPCHADPAVRLKVSTEGAQVCQTDKSAVGAFSSMLTGSNELINNIS